MRKFKKIIHTPSLEGHIMAQSDNNHKCVRSASNPIPNDNNHKCVKSVASVMGHGHNLNLNRWRFKIDRTVLNKTIVPSLFR